MASKKLSSLVLFNPGDSSLYHHQAELSALSAPLCGVLAAHLVVYICSNHDSN